MKVTFRVRSFSLKTSPPLFSLLKHLVAGPCFPTQWRFAQARESSPRQLGPLLKALESLTLWNHKTSRLWDLGKDSSPLPIPIVNFWVEGASWIFRKLNLTIIQEDKRRREVRRRFCGWGLSPCSHKHLSSSAHQHIRSRAWPHAPIAQDAVCGKVETGGFWGPAVHQPSSRFSAGPCLKRTSRILRVLL